MLNFGPSNFLIDTALGLAARANAQRTYQRLLQKAKNAIQLQERVLLERIKDNAQSDFGRRHQFSRIRSVDDFRNAVPIREYEQLRPCIQEVMDGHERALFGPGQRVLMFAMTSGSTDRPKYIPVTPQFVRDYRRGWNAFGGKALLDHPAAFMRPILQVSSPFDIEHTAHGVPCGSISGLLAGMQTRIVRRFYAAPPQVAQIADAESRYYTIMRFAVPRDVAWIVTASPATPLELARSVTAHADQLIRDIHDGTLTPPNPIPDSLASLFAPHLAPDPQTAQRLESLRSQSNSLIPANYWRLAFLANWTGGTLALHLREFPHYFGDTPVREIGLLATEGRVSIGLSRGTSTGLLDLDAGFFEFAEVSDKTPAIVHQCHELDTGGVYRVIITNSAGLYRYDIGDCVRVAGFEGHTPLLEFLHRGSRVCSMTGEKISEWQVTTAMERAGKALGITTANFVVAPAWSQPPFYRLYLEASRDAQDSLARRLDDELCRLNIEYAGKRSSQRLGPMQLMLLPCGALASWDIQCAKVHRSGDQYKHQYLFTSPDEDRGLFQMAKAPSLVRATGRPGEPDRDTASL